MSIGLFCLGIFTQLYIELLYSILNARNNTTELPLAFVLSLLSFFNLYNFHFSCLSHTKWPSLAPSLSQTILLFHLRNTEFQLLTMVAETKTRWVNHMHNVFFCLFVDFSLMMFMFGCVFFVISSV